MKNSIKMAQKAGAILDDKKAIDLKILDIHELTSVADFFLIATGTSTPHVKAMADELEDKLEEDGYVLLHKEGHREGNWVLLDYGVLVAHIFTAEDREFYGLEKVWSEAKEIELA